MEFLISEYGGVIAVLAAGYLAWKIGSRLLSWMMTAAVVTVLALIMTQ